MDKLLPAEQGRSFGALLHNTASPTMMDVGVKRNVIPSSATVEFDGRILPGYTARDLVREMEARIKDPEIDIEIVSETPPLEMTDYDTPLYQHIRRTVGRHDPKMIVTPYQIMGFTDAQYFSRLGTKFYGCSPLQLPKRYDIKFSEMFHGIDERVPREGYEWGQRVLFDIVSEFVQ